MGQARNRGTKELRIAEAIERAKTEPTKRPTMTKAQIRALAAQMASDMLHGLFKKAA